MEKILMDCKEDPSTIKSDIVKNSAGLIDITSDKMGNVTVDVCPSYLADSLFAYSKYVPIIIAQCKTIVRSIVLMKEDILAIAETYKNKKKAKAEE